MRPCLAILKVMRFRPAISESPRAFFHYGVICAVVFLLATTPADAAQKKSTPSASRSNNQETLITAEHMTSDQDRGIVTAAGKVEISRNDYVLHADKVSYNQNTNVMRAEGHVAIMSPSGEVQFADQEEITGDMKQAFAENIGILFPDNSRFAALRAQRYDGRYLVAEKANFTACNVCKEDPSKPPLWELHGQKVVHDNVEHQIYYHNATINFDGLPVFYTPYFSAPDPTVERRQGFLAPTPGVAPNLGTFVKVPYYFDIAPNQDAILAPTFSEKDKAQLGAQYRRRFAKGNLQLDGSFTRANLISDTGKDEGDKWRGNIFGSFLYNIDNQWRAGSNVAYSSDKSYLQRYRISSADQLTNRAYLENFKGRNYAVVNSYYFQDLRPGTQPVQPVILPEAKFSAIGEPGKTLGGRWSFDGGVLVTKRDNANQDFDKQGPETHRLSLNAGWKRQLTSDTGLVITPSALVRSDEYWADNVQNTDNSASSYNNVLLARQFAQANVVARYPMGRSGDGYQQLLEPIVALTAAPTVKTLHRQPIEDSLDVEFDETNLFSPNRFTGNDLIEGGSRATYGLRQAVTLNNGAKVDMFGGQSHDFSRNTLFPSDSGLADNSSDYVGRIDFLPVNWFNANYGFRLNQKTFSPERQDAVVSLGRPLFRPYARYISARQTQTSGLQNVVEEATLGFSSTFASYWTLAGSHTQAFQPQPGSRGTNLSLNYADECFVFGVGANHDDTQRADISSGTSIIFHFFLKNVGGVHTDGTTAGNFNPQFRKY